MRSMKRTLTLLLSAVLVVCAALCVAGCGGQQASSSATSSAASSSAASEAGKTLVVYFSATGNTEAVVQDIVDETGATSFAIQPAQPYTSEDLDYNDPDSRVSKETLDDWASYDTVLIGYPIWWGEAAYPVASFAKANDFTGKTVIPFCTSASSGLGQSAEHLSELANGGEWMGGMRFPSGVNGDEVRQWVDDLGLENQNL